MASEAVPAAPIESSSSVDKNAVLVLIAVAQFMVILDSTIVNVALPTIKVDVGFSEQNLSWVLNAYTLIFGGFLLLGGRAADRIGRRRIFMAGIAIFAALLLAVSLLPGRPRARQDVEAENAALSFARCPGAPYCGALTHVVTFGRRVRHAFEH
jgi:MFS family permease